MSGQATVWVRPLNGVWQAIGTATDRGVWHEGLTLISDQAGPKSATFTLYRSARGIFPDLLADTPVMVEVAGVRVWAGRISDAPEQSGAARQIDVSCDGWQAHLDDDAYERTYVHTDLTAYQDSRTILTAALTTLVQAWNVATDNGVITLGLAAGASAAIGTAGGVTLDLGPASTAKRIVITWDSSNNGGTNISFRARGSNDPNVAGGGSDAINFTLNGGASGTTGGTFSTDCRYVHLFLIANAALAPGSDLWLKVKSALVVADTAYESGNASILTADTIIKDALTHCPLLSADRTGIGAPGFDFPEFTMTAPQTPREVIAAANAPHNWRLKVDEYQRPVFSARPTAPVVDFGNWPGNESDGGSSSSAQGVVTKAIVRGTGPDGAQISVTRTQSGTIVDRQGGVRAQTLDSSFKLTSTLATQLGDTYLAAHKLSPFKGTVVVTPGGARRTLGGTPLHPAHLLALTGELARLTQSIDPDTGGVGRAVTIDTVTYRDDDLTAEVALDNTRTDFEALQARLGLLVPS